jgi:hypothetical protein
VMANVKEAAGTAGGLSNQSTKPPYVHMV